MEQLDPRVLKNMKGSVMRMRAVGIRCEIPLEGLGIGKQKAWYKEHEC